MTKHCGSVPELDRIQFPSPDGHVGSASLSTPLTALTFFVELPKNVAVQLVLLAGPVSQASVFAYLLAAWPFPRLEWHVRRPGSGPFPSLEGGGWGKWTQGGDRAHPSMTKTALYYGNLLLMRDSKAKFLSYLSLFSK